jgi:signal transduction histidine kinase
LSSNLTGHLAPDDPSLSPTTRAMLGLRDRVMLTWVANTRNEIAPARTVLYPILENTLPGFYDSIAALLTDAKHVGAQNDLGTLATEHGGERARLTPFDTISLIHELQLFRDAVFCELDKAGVRLDEEQRVTIHSYVDTAIRESVNSFVAVQAALREQFVAALTHDLRTPLSNAQMAAQLIERNTCDAETRRLAGKILENTRRIDSMTRELLNKLVFTGGNDLELHISQFEMADVVQEVAQNANSQCALDVLLPGEPIVGHWDRELIQRAIENLVSNAIKYGTHEHPVRILLTCTNQRSQVEVHNVGNPIPQEELENIFQLYRRAAAGRDQPEGWGVGLPLARRVAEAHGGSIMASSNPKDGTSFVIDVPFDARPFVHAPSAA